ncbi:hypothetical protein GCM10007981_18630 [Thermocladium modestius]|uniref:Uncharacterized protein n=1 Tax=Thermocladium modestius TaxID=62609 RepID=A0A830H0U8_9CREN|nr:hypothetical protein [Thermocladium modestius]GGP22463.1 hypothetical protein GCM10007981_18630 [Thermocladium modestius]
MSFTPEVAVDGNAVVVRIRLGPDVSASMLAKKLKERTGLEFAGLGDSVASVVTIDRSFMDDQFIKFLSDRVLSMLDVDIKGLAGEARKPSRRRGKKRRKSRGRRGRRSRKSRSGRRNS